MYLVPAAAGVKVAAVVDKRERTPALLLADVITGVRTPSGPPNEPVYFWLYTSPVFKAFSKEFRSTDGSGPSAVVVSKVVGWTSSEEEAPLSAQTHKQLEFQGLCYKYAKWWRLAKEWRQQIKGWWLYIRDSGRITGDFKL